MRSLIASATLVIVMAVDATMCPALSQLVMEVRGDESCNGCGIEFRWVVTLGGTQDPTSIQPVTSLARLADGHYYVSPTASPGEIAVYSPDGRFSPLVETSTGIGTGSSCIFNYTVTGKLEIGYTETATGLRGQFEIKDHKHTFVSATPSGCSSATANIYWKGALNGTASNLTFTQTEPLGTLNWKSEFTGALSDGVITGTLTFTVSGGNQGFTTSGSASTNVTLR